MNDDTPAAPSSLPLNIGGHIQRFQDNIDTDSVRVVLSS